MVRQRARPNWRRTVDLEAVDYSHLFLTRARFREIRQSAVTLQEVLDGLRSGDLRLHDEIVEFWRYTGPQPTWLWDGSDGQKRFAVADDNRVGCRGSCRRIAARPRCPADLPHIAACGRGHAVWAGRVSLLSGFLAALAEGGGGPCARSPRELRLGPPLRLCGPSIRRRCGPPSSRMGAGARTRSAHAGVTRSRVVGHLRRGTGTRSVGIERVLWLVAAGGGRSQPPGGLLGKGIGSHEFDDAQA